MTILGIGFTLLVACGLCIVVDVLTREPVKTKTLIEQVLTEPTMLTVLARFFLVIGGTLCFLSMVAPGLFF